MPPRPAGRTRSARAAGQAVAARHGVIARTFDRALDNPATSGGLMVVALTATAIISNALFLQSKHHPEPLFMTRPAAPVAPTPNLAPVPATPQDRAATIGVVPPEPSLAPAAAAAAEPDKTLVTQIQRELARLGLYVGSVDGIAGSRTKAAIAAYETVAGRPATGTASAELLQFIKTAPPPPPAAVKAPSAPPTAAETPPATVKTGAGSDAQPLDAAVTAERYRRVQTALNRAGYGPLAVDGQPGGDTADAIRRFELDNGLPITGDIGDKVIARLVTIGAMDAL